MAVKPAMGLVVAAAVVARVVIVLLFLVNLLAVVLLLNHQFLWLLERTRLLLGLEEVAVQVGRPIHHPLVPTVPILCFIT